LKIEDIFLKQHPKVGVFWCILPITFLPVFIAGKVCAEVPCGPDLVCDNERVWDTPDADYCSIHGERSFFMECYQVDQWGKLNHSFKILKKKSK